MFTLRESFFWTMIELGWAKAEEGLDPEGDPREAVFAGELSARAAIDAFLENLEVEIRRHCDRDGWAAFLQEFETKLFALDREDIATHLGLGDAEFFDARCFMILQGEPTFRGANRNALDAEVGPSTNAIFSTLRAEYEARFGGCYPSVGLGVVTGSNAAEWPSRNGGAGAAVE